nr:MAG TPA: hypothetical protein [Caudoviricetes sp.]
MKRFTVMQNSVRKTYLTSRCFFIPFVARAILIPFIPNSKLLRHSFLRHLFSAKK